MERFGIHCPRINNLVFGNVLGNVDCDAWSTRICPLLELLIPFGTGLFFPFSPAHLSIQGPRKPMDWKSDQDWWVSAERVFGSSTVIPVERFWCSFASFFWTCVAFEGAFPLFADVEKWKSPEIYPKDKRFKVGSTVSFCCIVPKAQHFSSMYVELLNASNANTTMVSRQIHAFTFQANNRTGQSCTHVRCDTTEKKPAAGVCAYFGCEYEFVHKCTIWTTAAFHDSLINVGLLFFFIIDVFILFVFPWEYANLQMDKASKLLLNNSFTSNMTERNLLVIYIHTHTMHDNQHHSLYVLNNIFLFLIFFFFWYLDFCLISSLRSFHNLTPVIFAVPALH